MNPKKLFKTLISTALVATLALTALPLTALAADKKTEPTYIDLNPTDSFFIKNKNSGKYLDVSGGKAKNGANVIQWGFTGKTNQQWRLQLVTYDTYKLVSELSYSYAIDIAGKSAKNGANAQLWKSSQTFRIVKVSGTSQPYYKFESVVSGSENKVLGVSESSKKDGANVNQCSFGKTGSDQWQFERVTKTTADSKPKYTPVKADYRADYVYLKNQNSGKYLDVSGGKTGNGKKIIQSSFTGKANQRFSLMKITNGNYMITTMIDAPNRYAYAVEVADKSKKAGSQFVLWDRSAGVEQQFSLKAQKDGSYKLWSVNGNNYLSVAGGSKNNGANVVLGSAGNVWVLESAQPEGPKQYDPYKHYPDSRKVDDIDMKALIAYGIQYGESIGMTYDPTMNKNNCSWGASITIGRRYANSVTEDSLRSRLSGLQKHADADVFGFWYEKGEIWRSDGPNIETMELYVGYGDSAPKDWIVDYD